MQKSAKIIITFLSILTVILIAVIIYGLVVFSNDAQNNINSFSDDSSQKDMNLKQQASKNSLSQNQKEKAEVVTKGNTQYLIYTNKNGKKTNIDKVIIDQKKAPDGKMISHVTLSPQKQYISYSIRTELDGENNYLYNIKTGKKNNVPLMPKFSNDDKYMILCGKSYPGFPIVQIYSMPEHQNILDVFGRFCDGIGKGCEGKYGAEFYGGYDIKNCDYSNVKEGAFEVTLKKEEKDKFNSPTGKILDEQIIKYDFQ